MIRSQNLHPAKTFILFLACFFCTTVVRAQFYSLPAEYSFHLLTERGLSRKDTLVHPALQPYIPFFGARFRNVRDSHRVFKYIKEDPAIDLLFHRHFIQVADSDEEFTLNIDPLLNLEAGKDIADSMGGRLYTNTRGIAASGTVGDRFYFETMVAENQALLPDFLAQTAETSSIIPGQGRWKRFKAAGYDYAFATGIASAQVLKNLNVQIGHGKQKTGYGYRSLLLSDNSFNYPFARITQQWLKGKVHYSNIFAVFMNLAKAAAHTTPHTERLFQKKLAAFQTVDLQLIPALNVSLFQGVVWKPGDSRNRQPAGWDYLNPVIYSHLLSKGLDNPDQNVIAGASALLKITESVSLYGQVMADHERDGYGFQAGVRCFDVLRIKGLTLQAEHNFVGKNAYQTGSAARIDHYNQPVGFTPGNGTEDIIIADYRKKRFFTHIRYHLQSQPDSTGSKTRLVNARIGYIINPCYNLNISVGYLGRRNFDTFSGINSHADYLYIAVRTSLYNVYYDF